MTHLQLGGKDPAYVRADANLEYTVAELVDGMLYMFTLVVPTWQICCIFIVITYIS
jgi:acyl-CoA reductase-like NAD-dependent aldehyde dehydrogenase